jgi:hypothetical protein
MTCSDRNGVNLPINMSDLGHIFLNRYGLLTCSCIIPLLIAGRAKTWGFREDASSDGRQRTAPSRARRASAHWSCVTLVIDPAHREDDSTVSARLRSAHRPLS